MSDILLEILRSGKRGFVIFERGSPLVTGLLSHVYLAQSVQRVVIDCAIHKAPDDCVCLRYPDAATRARLKQLNNYS